MTLIKRINFGSKSGISKFQSLPPCLSTSLFSSLVFSSNTSFSSDTHDRKEQDNELNITKRLEGFSSGINEHTTNDGELTRGELASLRRHLEEMETAQSKRLTGMETAQSAQFVSLSARIERGDRGSLFFDKVDTNTAATELTDYESFPDPAPTIHYRNEPLHIATVGPATERIDRCRRRRPSSLYAGSTAHRNSIQRPTVQPGNNCMDTKYPGRRVFIRPRLMQLTSTSEVLP